MKWQLMYSFLNTDITKIEKALEQTVHSQHPLLQEASLHLLKAGGKRIRPVFVLLSAKFGHYDFAKVTNVAVALELIHMASLVHDDVIDDAELRRGQQTIKAKWDNRIAMYTGDYIFARSLEQMTNIDNPIAHQVLADTIVEVCLGEIEQIKDKYNYDQHLRHYLRRIKRKTALLIAASCQLGAVATDAEPEVYRALYWFGYFTGMAFQITDDILDFVSTEEQLGKPAGSDLWQGNITLPVLYAMEDEALRAKISAVTERTSAEEMADIIVAIKQSDAIERAQAISDRYLAKAIAMLDKLPKNRARKSLRDIAKFIGKRKY